MRLPKRLPACSTRLRLDDWTMLAFILATAGMVSLVPLVFSVELANSPANRPVLAGEAGLWQELGAKD